MVGKGRIYFSGLGIRGAHICSSPVFLNEGEKIIVDKQIKNKALEIAIGITKDYAGSAYHPIAIDTVLETTYQKLLELYADIVKEN